MIRSGLSPIVSVVLLIAVAVAVGIMVTTWITGWVSQQTSSTALACAINTNYVIDSAAVNQSSTNTLLIRLSNRGSLGLYGFGVVLDNGTRVVQLNSSSSMIDQGGISTANKLGREQTTYLLVNMSNATLGYPEHLATLTEVRVTNDACNAVSAKTTSISQ